ncbi:MAG: N-acetylglutamate synthase-like GNAT family acetyltransferase [Candidatus Binatia bacterium]|jgi:N-acetylglutamate synthase-like GNAT family acetyltransferase
MFSAMSSSQFKIRRAHIGDLPDLRPLWRTAGIYSLELEKRFTEFQIVVNDEAQVVAAFGVEIKNKDAQIHSDVYADTEGRSNLRDLVWKRIKTLAENHGLIRLWATVDDFWRNVGFAEPDKKVRDRGGELFGATMERRLTLQLREEEDMHLIAETQFEMFQQSSVAERERILEQGKNYRNIAIAIAGLIVIGILIAVTIMMLLGK